VISRCGKRPEPLRDERGFTLPEVLTTVAILGILIAIVMALWNSVIESRRVDAAANQLASDLRLAHTKATNQLTDWRVIYEVGDPSYSLVRLSEVCPPQDEGGCTAPCATEVINRELPQRTEIVESSNGADPPGQSRFNLQDARVEACSADLAELPNPINEPGSTSTIEFNSDGGSYAYSGPISGLKVGSEDNPGRCYKFTVLASTSRVEYAKKDGCD